MKFIRRYIIYRSCGKEITVIEAINILQNNLNSVLLDVRSPQEFKEGHLIGATSLPLYDLNKRY